MRLAIDAVGIKGGGGASVLEAVLDAAVCDSGVSEVVAFVSPVSSRSFQLRRHEKVVEVECPAAESSRLVRAIWHERLLDAAVRKRGAQVLLCLCSMGRSRHVPCATFVQQALPYSSEAMLRLRPRKIAEVFAMKRLIGRSCRHAARVFVQTETMARWLIDAHSLPTAKFHVFTPAARRAVGPVSKQLSSEHPMDACPDGQRIFYVGNAEGYKNLDTVVDAMPALMVGRASLRLFLTIPAGHRLCRREGVVGLGTLNSDMLAGAYSRATLVVQPSLVETVGLPLLEAMGLGVPVVAADRPYAREICGEAALYFDPLSSASFANVAKELLDDECVREQFATLGRVRSERLRLQRPYESMISALCEMGQTLRK